ncbi:NlpC/P60 family protein [Sulfitobacter sp. S190]|uniref:NlpC/P60 family protein n=1 Tax=Sulfitobacter sp. S190 TaxID=2867022 RepID=UPI0021A3A8CB|nr:NlpC/P60 family protein [Sulfitobacter sp. S190]UWR21035.1 C40 family peptidase [Sulfitobacter sp. S190]
MSGAEIVQAARSWIGTPYVHQAALKGAGTDCLGLVRGIWRERFGAEPETVPAYSMDWSEPQGEERLWAAALRHLRSKPVAEGVCGDVVLFRMRQGAVAKHLGILSQKGGRPSFIHAYSGHGVVESALSAPWRRRVVACFEFPKEVI